MAVPQTLENYLHVHDTAVLNWWRTLLVDYGTVNGVERKSQPMLTVMSAPHRAAAAVYDTLVAHQWIPALTPEERKDQARLLEVLPLPFTAIISRDPEIATDRERPPHVLEQRARGKITGAGVRFPYPKADYINYEITLYAGYRYTTAYVYEWLRAQMGQGANKREIWLNVPHAQPFGNVMQPLIYQGMNDESDLEGDRERLFRWTFRFQLLAWMFLPSTGESFEAQTLGIGVASNGAGLCNCAPADDSPNMAVGLDSPFKPSRSMRASGSEHVSVGLTFDTVSSHNDILTITYKEPGDTVVLSDTPVAGAPSEGVDGLAPFRLYLEYKASGEHTLEVLAVHPDETNDPILLYSWNLAGESRWTILNKLLVAPLGYNLVVQYKAHVCFRLGIQVRRLGLHRIRASGAVPAYKAKAGPGLSSYWWRGVSNGYYLLVARVSGVCNSFEYQVQNNAFGAPTETQNNTHRKGAPGLVAAVWEPNGQDTFRLVVPETVPIAAVAFPYREVVIGDGLPV